MAVSYIIRDNFVVIFVETLVTLCRGCISTAFCTFEFRIRRYRCVTYALSYLISNGNSQWRRHRVTNLSMLIKYRTIETIRIWKSLGSRALSNAHNSVLHWMQDAALEINVVMFKIHLTLLN